MSASTPGQTVGACTLSRGNAEAVDTMADDDHRNARYELTPPGQWSHTPHIQPHSYHGTPATEFQGFHFAAPQLPMEPAAFSSGMNQRPVVHPLIMPQWPSMLPHSSQTTYQPIYPQPVQPIQPVTMGQLQTPVSASSTRSTTTPRKTLTDNDRKRMCQYAEEHPNAKQTEIGCTSFARCRHAQR